MSMMPLNETLLCERVASHRVVLFMKGHREMPQCGFSAQVVQILNNLLPSYETVDVLKSPELRDAIKAFSRWPTIPQLYVDGRFNGGLRHRPRDECVGRVPANHSYNHGTAT
jgi:monothiol glutaredoxin